MLLYYRIKLTAACTGKYPPDLLSACACEYAGRSSSNDARKGAGRQLQLIFCEDSLFLEPVAATLCSAANK